MSFVPRYCHTGVVIMEHGWQSHTGMFHCTSRMELPCVEECSDEVRARQAEWRATLTGTCSGNSSTPDARACSASVTWHIVTRVTSSTGAECVTSLTFTESAQRRGLELEDESDGG